MSARIFYPLSPTCAAPADSAPVPIESVAVTLQPIAETLDDVRGFLVRFIAFPRSSHATIVALWIAHTHALDAADFTPYLHISSPEKRCGKSRFLDCLAILARNAWQVAQPSVPVLFRKIAADCPALLLDEVDTIFTGTRSDENRETMRGVLNMGFQRGGKVARCEGDRHELKEFEVFCAKALAGIGTLPDTVADRSVPIVLARKPPGTELEKFRARDVRPQAEPFRVALTAWADAPGIIDALQSARPEIPDELGDRQADICEPLLAIADMAGGTWPTDARRALLDVYGSADTASSESAGVVTLRAIRAVFAEVESDRLFTDALLHDLCQRDDGPWAGWWSEDLHRGNTRGPSARLARMLRPYGITPGTIRIEGDTGKGYRVEQFDDAWARYCPQGPSENVTTSQPA